MKKIFLSVVSVTLLAFMLSTGLNSPKADSTLLLENIEALSRYELPEVEIVCSIQPGRCWAPIGGLKDCGERSYFECERTDWTALYCENPC